MGRQFEQCSTAESAERLFYFLFARVILTCNININMRPYIIIYFLRCVVKFRARDMKNNNTTDGGVHSRIQRFIRHEYWQDPKSGKALLHIYMYTRSNARKGVITLVIFFSPIRSSAREYVASMGKKRIKFVSPGRFLFDIRLFSFFFSPSSHREISHIIS